MAQDDPPTKALTKNPLGPSGRAVAANVERLRDQQNLTFAALSERLERIGRPIPPLGLRKIVAETRRVDADDLIGLAAALGVSPITLLIEDGDDPDASASVTGFTELTTARRLWEWLVAVAPLDRSGDMYTFGSRAWPKWFRRELVERERQQVQDVHDRVLEELRGGRRNKADGDG